MAAMRITFNTDHLSNDEARRKEVARLLPELQLLLEKGDYVGRFVLGAPWRVHSVKDNHSPAGGFPTQDSAINWVNLNTPKGETWTSEDFIFLPEGEPLTGDVDEL